MKTIIGFAVGLAFGFGLMLSGMTSPDKVLGFLDVTGQWDPTLAFVMGGAILAATPLFMLARRKTRPALVGDMFTTPTATKIDRRLVVGAILFGVGWGLAGLCPGPALVNLAIDPSASAIFVMAMLVGMLVSSKVIRKNG